MVKFLHDGVNAAVEVNTEADKTIAVMADVSKVFTEVFIFLSFRLTAGFFKIVCY